MKIRTYATRLLLVTLLSPACSAAALHLSAVAGRVYSDAVFDGEARLAARAADSWRAWTASGR